MTRQGIAFIDIGIAVRRAQPGRGRRAPVGLSRRIHVSDGLQQPGELEPQVSGVTIGAHAGQEHDRLAIDRGAASTAGRGGRLPLDRAWRQLPTGATARDPVMD